MLSPARGILESPLLTKGLENPCENTDLYDNYDIYHEMLNPESETDQDNDDSALYEEGCKTIETQSDQGTGRALIIPETGI